MPPDAIVVSHRRQVRHHLSRLLFGSPRAVPELPWYPWPASPAPESPGLAIVDVLVLFPQPADLAPSPWQAAPGMLLVGFYRDADALIGALGNGIPFHLLERLEPEMLRGLLSPIPPACDVDLRVAALCAARVRGYFERRWEQQLLTQRQEGVLALAVQGLSNRRIAQLMGIKEKTVKNHLGQAYAKLGVSSRVEAAARWAQSRPA